MNFEHIGIIYKSCEQTCNACDLNKQCNSCKVRTSTAFSNVFLAHYGPSITDFVLASSQTTHSGEKSDFLMKIARIFNKCNKCGFAFSHANDLSTHLKTHSGEMSNQCNQCDFASSHADNLRIHLKTHSGEKSNKCNQCDYASSQASSFGVHSNAHIGEKASKCNQCYSAFSYACSLKTHLKTYNILYVYYRKVKQMQPM